MDPTGAVTVLITAPNLEIARKLGRSLVEQKLAACANIVSPLLSIYVWEGEIQQDDEVLILVKTRAELVERALVPAVQALHPYEVPEIIALPILTGSKSYLDWIQAETAR
jgi:periplasmic divalent cation tolerance protein